MSALKKTKTMPVGAAIFIMIVLVLLGVVFGNRNALARASKDVYAELDVMRDRAQIVSGKAGNYLLLAGRLGVTGKDVTTLKAASDAANAMLKNTAKHGSKTAATYVSVITNLESAMNAVDAYLRDEIQKLPAADQNRATADREAIYNGWRAERMKAEEIDSYNASVQEFKKIYRGVAFKFMFGAYNFAPVGDADVKFRTSGGFK